MLEAGKKLHIIAGLGNPGSTYAKTRHNLGFITLDHIGKVFSIPFIHERFDTICGQGMIRDAEVVLVKPLAFMNRSGSPLKMVADYFSIPVTDMLIIYDDIDLEFGRIKIKSKGGNGGHKGLQSVIDAFESNEFMRLRIGIGRPESGNDIVGHVLGNFSDDEMELLDQIVERAGKAAVSIITGGILLGMNKFN